MGSFRTFLAAGNQLALSAALTAGLAACAPAAMSDNTADDGVQRVVSLNPCLDAILVEVARPGQILALSHFSANPQSSSIPHEIARRYDVTGGTVEEVVALQPDIVLASTFMAPATRAAFDELGVRVEAFGSPMSVEESIDQVGRLAQLMDRKTSGDALAAEIRNSISNAGAGEQRSAVLWQPGGIVPGDQQLISELLRAAGFSSHSAKLGLDQADYLSLEQVVASPPDVLLVAGQSRAQQHPALAQTDTLVSEFDPALLYCGGPTIPRAMQRLRQIREQLS
uniref:ABC transporter substrate-binding protein n=1 Tax=uncultured Altererythrobacter sp. TaxID=500840 RepID=UPI002602457F|nr:ABC transporter substrate-binding protein [uncultured Altererythrobacter sp.]